MALLCSRFASRAFRGPLAVPYRSYASEKSLPDPMELATGHEKFEKEQQLAGNLDPFKEKPMPRILNSTRDNPNLVPSFFDCRAVACSCNPDSSYLIWMWVFKGEPKRCRCGHWFKLVEYRP